LRIENYPSFFARAFPRPSSVIFNSQLSIFNCPAGIEQLSLFDDAHNGADSERAEKLELAIDAIRSKFGKHSVQRAAILGNDLGIRDSDESGGE
jgi:hypothetical protein